MGAIAVMGLEDGMPRMSRQRRLKALSDGEVLPVYECGNGCAKRFDTVHLLGFSFDISWSECHHSQNGKLVDLMIEVIGRELGVKCVPEGQAFAMLRCRGNWTYVRVPKACNGHYSRRLCCLRDVAKVAGKRVRDYCKCGKVTIFSVYHHHFEGPSKRCRRVSALTLVPFYRRIATGEWVSPEPVEPWQIRGDDDIDWSTWESARVCSASCWLRSLTAWRSERAAELKKQREMKWIRRSQAQMKTIRRFLSQPGSYHEALQSPAPGSKPEGISAT